MDNYLLEFKKKVKRKKIKIAVVGLGYVGLPLAIEFAKKGFVVFGILHFIGVSIILAFN